MFFVCRIWNNLNILYTFIGGELSQNDVDIVYRGGSKKNLFINFELMFQEIPNRVYDVVGCDRMYVKLKLFMRYPMPGKYVPIALEDDESLSAMFSDTNVNHGNGGVH